MSQYCLIHISDVHVKIHEEQAFTYFERAAATTLIEGVGQIKDIIVLMTGDLAYSGLSEEYDLLQKYIDRFKSILTEKGFSCRFAFVPGNHDCNFKLKDPIRELLVKNVAHTLNRENSEKSVISTFLDVQSSFIKFCSKNEFTIHADRLVSITQIDELKLKINCLNTAWASEMNESDNRPFILSELEALKLQPGYLNLTLFHHPKSWIDKTIVGAFSKTIHENSDFTFTGHEHTSNTYEVQYTNGETQTYFESGAFHDGRGSSQFRAVLINLEKECFSIIDFSWNRTKEIYEKKVYNNLKFPQTPQANSLGFLIDQNFSKFLKDPEVPVKHTMQREVELRDFYVFPRLIVDQGVVTENGPAKIIGTENELLNTILEKKLCLITGNDKSGKTALCKTIFESSFVKGSLPLYIGGDELKSSSSVVLKNLISEKLRKQFNGVPGIEIFQNPDIRSVLIIDRFDQIDLPPRKVGELLSILSNLFSAVALTADSSIEIQLLDDPRFGMPIDDIVRLQIGPLSQTQRKELVSKWISLGNAIKFDTNDSRVHQLELYLSTVVSEYGIPNYPLFILMYLEVAESASSTPNLNISSNAKLLETLVNLSLLKVTDAVNSQQTQIAYLRELAFHFHTVGKARLTIHEINMFHETYCSKLDVVVSREKIWRELCDAKILIFDGDMGGFKYPYFRSFFVAAYLNFYSTSPGTKEIIKSVIENIHILENASILATLSLYSAEIWVFDDLKAKLDGTLKGHGKRGFAEVSQAVERITKNKDFPLLPDMHDSHELEPSQSKEEIFEISEPVFHLSQAIRLIKVLGQLIRNSANTLDGARKKELVQSVFDAAGRILEVQSLALENGRDEILVYIYLRLREKKPNLSEAEARSQATQRIAFLLSGSAIGLIDVVSRAIGDEFLDLTFKKIRSEDSEGILDYFFLGIKLDWYKNFPKAELLALSEDTGSTGFRAFIIRYLAFRSMVFRANDLGASTLQELCGKLEINFKRLQLRLVSATKSSRID